MSSVLMRIPLWKILNEKSLVHITQGTGAVNKIFFCFESGHKVTITGPFLYSDGREY